MNKKIKIFLLILTTILLPSLTLAQNFSGITTYLNLFASLLNLVTKIVFALAFLYFFWGMGQFILHSDDKTAREEGKKRMMWGVTALFVMFSIYGILYLLQDVIGFNAGSSSGPGSIPGFNPFK